MLSPGEDNRTGDFTFFQQARQKHCLVFLFHEVGVLTYAFSRRRDGRDRYLAGIFLKLLRKSFNFRRHGRGEKHGLALTRQGLGDAFERVNEAHIEHLVCFVQNKVRDVIQRHGFLLHQVFKAPWGRDKDVSAFFKRSDLLINRNAAEDDVNTQTQQATIFAERLSDLSRQLAGWCQDEAAHAFADAIAFFLTGVQVVQQWQSEGCGFASACLCNTEHIFARENQRNSLSLDWGRLCIAKRVQRFDERSGEAEIGKLCHLYFQKMSPFAGALRAVRAKERRLFFGRPA